MTIGITQQSTTSNFNGFNAVVSNTTIDDGNGTSFIIPYFGHGDQKPADGVERKNNTNVPGVMAYAKQVRVSNNVGAYNDIVKYIGYGPGGKAGPKPKYKTLQDALLKGFKLRFAGQQANHEMNNQQGLACFGIGSAPSNTKTKKEISSDIEDASENLPKEVVHALAVLAGKKAKEIEIANAK
jgi:hypothetical protein